MSGKEKIKLTGFRKIGIDTNIFIYHLQNVAEFKTETDVVFEALEQGSLLAVTSIVAKAELLSYKRPREIIEDLKEKFESTPGLSVFDVDEKVALKAAELRRKYNFRLPDAIQIASAIVAKAGAFLTNDGRLKKCKEIKVIVIK